MHGADRYKNQIRNQLCFASSVQIFFQKKDLFIQFPPSFTSAHRATMATAAAGGTNRIRLDGTTNTKPESQISHTPNGSELVTGAFLALRNGNH